jgi:hypothetical protein
MSFPITSVLDNFNRANGDAGADWSEMMRAGNDFNIDSNQITGDDWNAEIYNPATYGPDCEVYATIATMQSQADSIILFVRMKDVTADSYAYDGYEFNAYRFNDGGTDTMRLIIKRVDNSAATQLGASVDITDHGNGDKLGGRIIGEGLDLWYDDGAGWELRAERSDSTYGAAGYLVLGLPDNVPRVDDFGGGTLHRGYMTTMTKFWGGLVDAG